MYTHARTHARTEREGEGGRRKGGGEREKEQRGFGVKFRKMPEK